MSTHSHIPVGWATETLREDVRRTFSNRPRVLRPLWLYDDRGAALFDEITRLPEYYPTEAERSILARVAGEIASRTHADTVVELGSGTSDKTRTLLDAFWSTGRLVRFVPFDVTATTLAEAAAMLSQRYQGLTVEPVVGDFTQHLRHLPQVGTRLVAFLGGTVGNFYSEERRAFFGAMADTLNSGDWLLLGVDLLKDSQRIIDAYNDERGVTARFISNALLVLNRELDADFPVDQFDYVPFWDTTEGRVDMRLRAAVPFTTRISALDLDVVFEQGEELRVEISTKFDPETLSAELVDAGFELHDFWMSQPERGDGFQPDDFGLVLARRR